MQGPIVDNAWAAPSRLGPEIMVRSARQWAVRTVDHGTAFAMVGSGHADAST